MITSKDSVNTTKMIEKFVGTEYDTLFAIYSALPALLSLKESVDSLNNRYQGVLESSPVLRPDGSDLQTGDYYYHALDKLTYYFVNGTWSSAVGAMSDVQVVTVTAPDIVGADTFITFENSISQASGGNIVFVGTAYQFSVDDDVSGAYEIVGDRQIKFTGVELEIGEVVTIITGNFVNTIQPLISVKTGYYVVDADGQTIIPMVNGITYQPGANNLQVFLNGKILNNVLHYIEENTTSIRLIAPALSNDVITFMQGALVTTHVEPQNGVITLPLFSSVDNNQEWLSTLQDKVLIFKGGYSIGDGSGGTYVYDISVPKSSANGATAIDPTVMSYNQGNGVGQGCWRRQYEGTIKPEWFNTPYEGMAALRLCLPLPNDRVIIDSFYEEVVNEARLGGGLYHWEADRSAETHNGGTIISPLVIDPPGTIAWYTPPAPDNYGCWVKQDTGRVSSDTFGADATGVVNADAAFAAMVTAGIPIEITAGTFLLTGDHVSTLFYSYGVVTINGGGSAAIKNLMA